MTEHNHFDPEELAHHLDNLLSGDLEALPADDPLLDVAQNLMNESPPMPSIDALKRMQEGMLKANANLHPAVNVTSATLSTGQMFIVGTLTVIVLIGVVIGTVWGITTLFDDESATETPLPEATLGVTDNPTLDSVMQEILTSTPTLTNTSTLTRTSTATSTNTLTPTLTATPTPSAIPTSTLTATRTQVPVSNNNDSESSGSVVQTPPIIAPTSPPANLGENNDNANNSNNGNTNPGDFGCEHPGNYCNSQGTPGGSSPGNSGGNNGNGGGNGNGGNNGNGRGNGG